MAVISLDCPNCGAKLSPDDSTRRARCQYCGASFKLAKTIAQQPARPTTRGGPTSPTHTPAGPAAGRRMVLLMVAMSAIGIASATYFNAVSAPSGALQAALGGKS